MDEKVKAAVRLAANVGFLTTREERELYAGAILAAIEWGESVSSKQNK